MLHDHQLPRVGYIHFSVCSTQPLGEFLPPLPPLINLHYSQYITRRAGRQVREAIPEKICLLTDIDNLALTPPLVFLDTSKELFLNLVSKQKKFLKMFGF